VCLPVVCVSLWKGLLLAQVCLCSGLNDVICQVGSWLCACLWHTRLSRKACRRQDGRFLNGGLLRCSLVELYSHSPSPLWLVLQVVLTLSTYGVSHITGIKYGYRGSFDQGINEIQVTYDTLLHCPVLHCTVLCCALLCCEHTVRVPFYTAP